MPTLPILSVRIQGITPDPTPTSMFDWSVEITFDTASTTNGKLGVVFTDRFGTPQVQGGSFTVVWPARIRGGDLTITASTVVNGTTLDTSFVGTVTGTDPATADIRAELQNDDMRRIANVESGFHQFEVDPGTRRVVPKYNAKFTAQKRARGDGGVGICQITVPAPTAEETWNWKENVKSGRRRFAATRGRASALLNQHRVNGRLANRLGLGDAEVIRREAIQGYNGGQYWRWNEQAQQWEDQPPNSYVTRVLNAVP